MRLSTKDLLWPDVDRIENKLLAVGQKKLDLDFSEVEFVTGAALGKLLALRPKLDMTFKNVRPEVYEVFQITGLSRVFAIATCS